MEQQRQQLDENALPRFKAILDALQAVLVERHETPLDGAKLQRVNFDFRFDTLAEPACYDTGTGLVNVRALLSVERRCFGRKRHANDRLQSAMSRSPPSWPACARTRAEAARLSSEAALSLLCHAVTP